MKKHLLLIAMVVLTITPSVAQKADAVSKRIIEIGTTDNQAMDHLDVLTNRIGGRLIGSSNYDIAVEWAAAEFEKWGWEVELQKVGDMSVGFNRGPWFGRMLSEDGMNLHFVTPSYTAGTKGAQRGHVLSEPKTQAEFERMKGALKGAWVLIGGTNSGWPIDRSERGDSIREVIKQQNLEISAYNDSLRRERGREAVKDFKKPVEYPALYYREMVEAGILGTIQSASVPLRALYDRECLSGDMTFDNLPTVADIKLDEAQYDIIAKKVSRRDYFLLEFDIRNHFRPGPVPYYNVIATIKGSKYPDEYVVSGGHLDAFDVATGGVDCGSGSTANMEAARLIGLAAQGERPLRTIAVCLWAGEEFGLFGSTYWVKSQKEKGNLDNISNYFNRDGGPLLSSALTVTDQMYDMFERVCAPLNSIDDKFPFTLNKRKGGAVTRASQAGGSDHTPFVLEGIPSIRFAETDPLGYDFNYGEIWHTERDLYNKSIAEYQEHSAIVMAVVMWRLANEKEKVSREGLYLD